MENHKINNERLKRLLEASSQKSNLSESFEELGLEALNLVQGGLGSGCTSMCGIDCGIF